MKNLILTILFSVLVFWGCSNEDIDNPISPQQGSGKIQLRIDKANAPADVVTIDAVLTRDGYDTITGTLNLLSDSTADIMLDEIPVGIWNLMVDAKDDVGVILYTGETEVEIFAGFVTQVNLTLNPTGEGVGSIYIYVKWGQISTNWTDYEGNPIFSSSGNYWDYSGVQQPKILFENNLLKLYYTAQGDPYSGYAGYAFSSDGINWTISPNNPVLSPGPAGSWDETAVAGATVFKDESGYRMYYAGWSNPSANWNIGLATSTDGINWVKHPDPVLYSGSGWEFQLGPSSVIKVDNVYYLYYYGRNLPVMKIGLATSTDGINWTRDPSNPILVADQPWEETGVYYANVYEKNNQYEMIYMNTLGTAFGRAISTDGISWIKDETNPFFTNDETHNHWADSKIAYPNYIKINNKDRIYYTGFSSGGFTYKIGFVTK